MKSPKKLIKKAVNLFGNSDDALSQMNTKNLLDELNSLKLELETYKASNAGYENWLRASESDFSDFDRELFSKVAQYTMTSKERLFAFKSAIEYVVSNNINGDLVECGVWRGGSMMLACLTLMNLGAFERTLYLYDTFDGMSEPTEDDVDQLGRSASNLLADSIKTTENFLWAYASLEDVKRNIYQTSYPTDKIRFIQGKVENTIPNNVPEEIAVLRLDTDWFESTYHELLHLFPKLVPGGVLIIDDYGYWKGSRKAVDRYFVENNIKPFLHRVDHTCRLMIKY
ncbi:MAG: TylF/MycF family methyltransferase [Sediminibacterium sp.]|jgi:hypothetical protein|nr:TylF/MycF family methyltransferase [Sediminibacterium sp.]